MSNSEHWENIKEIAKTITRDSNKLENQYINLGQETVFKMATMIYIAEKLNSVANSIDLIKCGD